MRKLLAAAGAAVLIAGTAPAFALEATSGKVVRVDRERQVVRLHTGQEFHLTNRAFMSHFTPRPRATFWYRVVDGKNIVVHFRTELIDLD